MTDISPEEILEYFKSKNNRFKNSKGMELGLTAAGELWTSFYLCNHNHGPLAFSIHSEDESPTEFIEQFKLKAIEEINNLDYTSSWMRYLNGEAEINVIPFELEATLGFKIVKRKTIVFSLDLHFYDEVYEHLTLPEDFEKYISLHENRLGIAQQNRYKMNRK
ncbi:MAG: hypothetical protein JWP81_1555 [Ferruginibacter sp.]|nr:hypothetical protein [Ferruginibacter sp.]